MMLGLAIAWHTSAAVPQPISLSDRIVFYYGDTPSLDTLSRFDLAVVEPDVAFIPPRDGTVPTRWLAYVSVGEVEPSRHYRGDIPADWIVGRNDEWGSDIIDMAQPAWPQFFVERVVAPLWERGYTGFFLDTLDSYLLVARGEQARARNRDGLVRLVRALRERYPDATVIMNRGFELLPDVHGDVDALAFESLFKGWNEARREYVDVPVTDRQWLLDRVAEVRTAWGLPMIAIDYCPPGDAACRRQTIQAIRSLGLIPYIGDGRLQDVPPSQGLHAMEVP